MKKNKKTPKNKNFKAAKKLSALSLKKLSAGRGECSTSTLGDMYVKGVISESQYKIDMKVDHE